MLVVSRPRAPGSARFHAGSSSRMPPNWRGMINVWRDVWVDAPRRAESCACPPDPSPHVQPKPGGAARLPWLLLVKPDRTGNEILDGILGHG